MALGPAVALLRRLLSVALPALAAMVAAGGGTALAEGGEGTATQPPPGGETTTQPKPPPPPSGEKEREREQEHERERELERQRELKHLRELELQRELERDRAPTTTAPSHTAPAPTTTTTRPRTTTSGPGTAPTRPAAPAPARVAPAAPTAIGHVRRVSHRERVQHTRRADPPPAGQPATRTADQSAGQHGRGSTTAVPPAAVAGAVLTDPSASTGWNGHADGVTARHAAAGSFVSSVLSRATPKGPLEVAFAIVGGLAAIGFAVAHAFGRSVFGRAGRSLD